MGAVGYRDPSEKKPHKHAELIKAWADNPNLEFEFRGGGCQYHCWYTMKTPDWSHSEIRIKPTPKPDFILYGIENNPSDVSVAYTNSRGVFVLPTILTSVKTSTDTVKFTFDGETGKLKDVEIMK